MKHKPKAVEKMARYLFDADPLNIEAQVSWEDFDDESLESYDAYTIAALDAAWKAEKMEVRSDPK